MLRFSVGEPPARLLTEGDEKSRALVKAVDAATSKVLDENPDTLIIISPPGVTGPDDTTMSLVVIVSGQWGQFIVNPGFSADKLAADLRSIVVRLRPGTKPRCD